MSGARSEVKRSEFTGMIVIRCPPQLPAAVTLAADREMTTISAYVRSALVRQLRRDGLNPQAARGLHPRAV